MQFIDNSKVIERNRRLGRSLFLAFGSDEQIVEQRSEITLYASTDFSLPARASIPTAKSIGSLG